MSLWSSVNPKRHPLLLQTQQSVTTTLGRTLLIFGWKQHKTNTSGMKSSFSMSMNETTTDEPDLATPDLNTNSSCESHHQRLLV